jgi:ATP-binding cassette subfamily C (CFTR/MRP) protein 10
MFKTNFSLQVFTSLALINILIMPLNAFPWTLNGVIEAFVSLKRLQRFHDMPEMDDEQEVTGQPENGRTI